MLALKPEWGSFRARILMTQLTNRPGVTCNKEGIGQSVKRVEDLRMITGKGTYIDDIKAPGLLYMHIVRSTQAHAHILSIDTSQARTAKGVRLVLTGAELSHEIGPLAVDWDSLGLRCRNYPCMPHERVRYVGQPIALVVAEDPYLAQDAARLVEVTYAALPPVIDVEKALLPGASLLYPEWGTNETCAPIRLGEGDVDAAFAEADRVIEARLYSHRYSGYPMETRGCIASYDPAQALLTLYSSTQAPNQVRTSIAGCLGLGENEILVRARDVGGGFGIKDAAYPEEVLASYVARKFGIPVKWIEGRSESFLASSHAREQVHMVQLAVKNDGIVLAIKDTILYDAGAHHLSRGALPAMLTASMLPGPYAIRAAEIVVHAVVTNKVPSGSYRGFGMTQSTFVMERLMDLAAAELGMNPADIRRKNFIQPEQVASFITAAGTQYDSGDYPAAFEHALGMLDYAEVRRQQAELRKKGVYLGIGLAPYVECTALGPSKYSRDIGFLIPSYETARVSMDLSGKVTVWTGIMPIGQGAQTAFSQIVVDSLGVSLANVRIIYGDTDACPYSGMASAASRGSTLGGAAIKLACEHILKKVKIIAGNMLESATEDIAIEVERVWVRGAPDKTVPLSAIARAAYFSQFLPEDEKPGLTHEEVYNPVSLTYAYGTHACLVSVDPETGFVDVLKYVVCHDCGTRINPALVEAQVHGGVVQGLGAVLMEELPYDTEGQLLATNFTDYHLPRAAGIPEILVDHMETPAPQVPGGFKGCGEGGLIPSPAAIANAVADALTPFGVVVTSTPLTPEKVWELLNLKSGSNFDVTSNRTKEMQLRPADNGEGRKD